MSRPWRSSPGLRRRHYSRVRAGKCYGRVQRNGKIAPTDIYTSHVDAHPRTSPFMSPKELKSLMARTRTSSPMLAAALGIAPQQIRKWRAGTRPVPERHIPALCHLFHDRAEHFGLEQRDLPEIPELVDPREIAPAPIKPRITIHARDPPLPRTDTATIVQTINAVLAPLARSFTLPKPRPE